MKDLLKRLLCIVLALTMVVALVACGSSDEDEDEDEDEETTEEGGKKGKETEEETTEEPEEEDSLVGEWEATIDMSDFFSDLLYGLLGVDVDVDGMEIIMTIEFDEDGTYKREIDSTPAEDAAEDLYEELCKLVIEIVAEQYGVTAEEVEALLAEEGATIEDVMEELGMYELLEETLAEIFGGFEDADEGKWILDGDELYMAKKKPENADPVIIEFDGDEFSIVEGEFTGDEDLDEYFFPIVFERV